MEKERGEPKRTEKEERMWMDCMIEERDEEGYSEKISAVEIKCEEG